MRRIIVSLSATALLGLAVLTYLGADRAAAQSPAKSKQAKAAVMPSFGNTDAIGEDELKIHLYFLASDPLEGRNFPSRGYDAAALYVASHLAEWGLKPGGSSAGTTGPLQPYFMPMELVARQIVPEESKTSLTAPAPAGRGGFAGGDGGGGGANAELRTTNFEY